MNISFINKVSYKILGLPIIERVEVHSEKQGEDNSPINIIVKKDYYDSEFNIKEEKDNDTTKD